MIARSIIAALAACVALGAANADRRVVSLDYCADQYVLALVPRDEIRALSPDAEADFSYLAEEAAGLPQVRPRGEDVLALAPTTVVRSYGGGPGAPALYARVGVEVVSIGWAGDLEAVRALITETAEALAAPERGAALIAAMDARLAALAPVEERTALYMTPGGVTTGPGSLMDAVMTAAGLSNFETKPGWRALPLERLARERPDVAATAFYGSRAAPVHAWSAARHPLARDVIADARAAPLDGAWTACGGWFVAEAAAALNRAALAEDTRDGDAP